MLADSYHSDLVAEIKAADFTFQSGRLTVHLAREFGFCYGVDRAVDYAYQARQRFPDQRVYPDRRDHSQPARQRPAARAGHPLPQRRRRIARRADAERRRHPAGLRHHRRAARDARRPRLHARRHDLRLGAERLEERQALRRGGLHVGHSRQVLARGDPGHRVAGPAGRQRPLPRRARPRPRRRSSATTSAAGGDRARTSWRAFERAVSPGFDPDLHLQRIGCANQTTMLSSESLEIGEMFREAMRDRYGDAELRRALPRLRHDLQRHAGPAGRRHRAARRRSRST